MVAGQWAWGFEGRRSQNRPVRMTQCTMLNTAMYPRISHVARVFRPDAFEFLGHTHGMTEETNGPKSLTSEEVSYMEVTYI